jgi:hypothetical protein
LCTFLLLLFAAAMRDVMLPRFSASCFARWGFICMSSAIVDVAMRCAAGWTVYVTEHLAWRSRTGTTISLLTTQGAVVKWSIGDMVL